MHIPWIDIHTHTFRQESGVLSVYNVIYGNEKKRSPISFSIGVHPWYIPGEIDWKRLEDIVARPECLAVGEIGMDRIKSNESQERQEAVFLAQVELANRYGKPVIIHCVRCFDRLSALRKYGRTPWIIHGFDKKDTLMRQLIAQGFWLSFGKALLSNDNQAFVRSVERVDLDKIFFETDDSDRDIRDIYAAFARMRGISPENLRERVFDNFRRVFKNSVI